MIAIVFVLCTGKPVQKRNVPEVAATGTEPGPFALSMGPEDKSGLEYKFHLLKLDLFIVFRMLLTWCPLSQVWWLLPVILAIGRLRQ